MTKVHPNDGNGIQVDTNQNIGLNEYQPREVIYHIDGEAIGNLVRLSAEVDRYTPLFSWIIRKKISLFRFLIVEIRQLTKNRSCT